VIKAKKIFFSILKTVFLLLVALTLILFLYTVFFYDPAREEVKIEKNEIINKKEEVDVEANIPIGKRNVNNMAILLAIDNYDDINFTETKFSGRDGKIFFFSIKSL